MAACVYSSAALSPLRVACCALKKTVPFGMRVLAKGRFKYPGGGKGRKGRLCTSLMANKGVVCKYCCCPNSPFTSM